MLKNLHGFQGKKYGLNPKNTGEKVYGVELFQSVSDLPETPEMAIIVIPSKYVASALQDCGKNGIKNVVVISAGFKEMGNEGEEKELVDIAENYDIDLLGPNCLGFLNPHLDLNLSFASGENLKKGNIGLVSQSGAMAVAMMDWAQNANLGFSKIISMGNKADINENDFLEYFAEDPETDVIVMYLESLVDGRKFYETAKRVTQKKPVIVVKSGISEKGALAASSHTGALSGQKEILETALKQAGVHSTHSLKELFLWSALFAQTKGKEIPEQLLMVTNAGGPGVMAVDNAEAFGVDLFSPSDDEEKILMENMPAASSMKNPLDILGDADSGRYKKIFENIDQLRIENAPENSGMTEDQTFAILILLTPQTVTDTENIAREIIAFQEKNPEQIIMVSFMGGNSVEAGRKILKQSGIPHFNYPKAAINAFSRLQKQKQIRIKNESPSLRGGFRGSNKQDKKRLHRNIQLPPNPPQRGGSTLLPPHLVSQILKSYHIPFAEEVLLTSEKEIEKIYTENQAGVMKISSPDIAHKTDVGGVILGIDSLEKAKESYHQILERVKEKAPDAKINGVTYQPMFPQSREVFVGMTRDHEFGEVMIFGLGGIYLNIFEDVTRRISPVSKKEIKEMITEIKAYKILSGARGEQPIDFEALEDIISKISILFHAHSEIQEIDINPIFCLAGSAWVMDAKIFL